MLELYVLEKIHTLVNRLYDENASHEEVMNDFKALVLATWWIEEDEFYDMIDTYKYMDRNKTFKS